MGHGDVGGRGRVVGLAQTPTQGQVSSNRRVGDRYVLRSNLGSGGMGEVWSAYDEVLNRHVAIKGLYLHPEFSTAEREQLRIRSLREARAAARIASPTAVAVYDVLEDNHRPWIVMELVNARSLAEVIRADGPQPVESVARIGLAMLEALEAAHAANVVHRDVKPANVLLATDGRVVLTDFGVATVDGDPGMTMTGMVMGSPAYMAPERAQGLEPTPGMDLWGLGATLFAAVEGKGPFSRKDALTTLHAVLTEPLPPLERAGALAPLLQGLLDRDTTTRLNASQARVLLLQIMRGMEGTAQDANRVPETDISGMDTASLRVLPQLPPSVLNKPPLDMSVSTPSDGGGKAGKGSKGLGSKGSKGLRGGSATHLPGGPGTGGLAGGKHEGAGSFGTTALLAVLLVVLMIGGLWFGLSRIRAQSNNNGGVGATPNTAMTLSTPSADPATSTGPVQTPNRSLVPSVATTTIDAQNIPAPAPGFKAQRNDAFGYYLDVPEQWNFKEQLTPGAQNPPVQSDIRNTYEDSRVARLVQVQRLNSVSNSDTVIAASTEILKKLKNYELLDSQSYPGPERVLHINDFRWFDERGTLTRTRQVLVIYPNKQAYSIFFTADPKLWDDSQKVFSQIIRSFRVLPLPPAPAAQ